MRPSDVEALKQLALLGALDGPVELASGDFSSLIQVSQQTASRRLIELAEGNLIQREMGMRRQRIRITDEGRSVLHAEHLLYHQLFTARDQVRLEGVVRTGLGEGRYYLSRPGYRDQFEEALGWVPYPGTLNLEIPGPEANRLGMLLRNPVHLIEGFQAEGRTFGGVTCHPARLQGGHECAAILPHRSHHSGTLELIAPQRLRDLLPCQDGDTLEVTVFLSSQPQAGEGA